MFSVLVILPRLNCTQVEMEPRRSPPPFRMFFFSINLSMVIILLHLFLSSIVTIVELHLVFTQHRLNMELDLKILFGLGIQLYSLAETPPTTQLPPHLGSYTGSLLVSQDTLTTSLCNPLLHNKGKFFSAKISRAKWFGATLCPRGNTEEENNGYVVFNYGSAEK